MTEILFARISDISVSNADGTLTITPTTGNIVASLNLGHANTWNANQTFLDNMIFSGTSIIDLPNGGTISSTGINGINIGQSTPGTGAFISLSATSSILCSGLGGVGYISGAGGVITQGTSRTTAVVINRLSGSITLFSAAGSTTPTTFQVQNNLVSVFDVVLVTVQSATDLYEVFVTATSNGHFNITFFTTGGTTVEQPIFNFAVIKGVNS